jgi:hypothetical protein
VFRTLDSLALETLVHRHLKEWGRYKMNAIGREWFYSTAEEVIEICKSLSVSKLLLLGILRRSKFCHDVA